MHEPASMHTDMAESDRHLLATILRLGYGVEDAAVAHGLDLEQCRDCVAYWRRFGHMQRILTLPSVVSTRTRAAFGL